MVDCTSNFTFQNYKANKLYITEQWYPCRPSMGQSLTINETTHLGPPMANSQSPQTVQLMVTLVLVRKTQLMQTSNHPLMPPN